MKKVNQKGFTLAELLIVVAIIAVLVAVAIPTFNNELEKSREATDVGNLRSAFAAASAYLLAHPENTADKLYFNPSAPENISKIADDNGAKIGRKAAASGQQSGDAKINFNTDYTFGPTTGELGAGKNPANADAVIEITVNTTDNSIALVSFQDDKAPLSVTWKAGKPDTFKANVGQKTITTPYDVESQIDIKVFGTPYAPGSAGNAATLFESTGAPAYAAAVETATDHSSLVYYKLGFGSDTTKTQFAITDADKGIANPTDSGAVTYIPIKLTAKVKGDTENTEKILYVPVQIEPAA